MRFACCLSISSSFSTPWQESVIENNCNRNTPSFNYHTLPSKEASRVAKTLRLQKNLPHEINSRHHWRLEPCFEFPVRSCSLTNLTWKGNNGPALANHKQPGASQSQASCRLDHVPTWQRWSRNQSAYFCTSLHPSINSACCSGTELAGTFLVLRSFQLKICS